METKKIEIVVEQRTAKKDGKEIKFNAYKTFTKNGRKIDVKFTKDVKDLPTEHCMAIIDVDMMNRDDSGRFPVIWVKDVVSYESIEATRKAKNKEKLDELFD